MPEANQILSTQVEPELADAIRMAACEQRRSTSAIMRGWLSGCAEAKKYLRRVRATKRKKTKR